MSAFDLAASQTAAMFANCATFISEGGSGANVFVGDPGQWPIINRPFVIVDPQMIRHVLDSGGFSNHYLPRGVTHFTIVRDTPASILADGVSDRNLNHLAFFGSIIDEWNAQSGDGKAAYALAAGQAFNGEAEILQYGKVTSEDEQVLTEMFAVLGVIQWGEGHGSQHR